MGRGRPAHLSKEDFVPTVISKVTDIYVNGNVVGKEDEVWKILSKIFQGKLLPKSIHAMVVTNRYKVLDAIKKQMDSPSGIDGTDTSIRSLADSSCGDLNVSDLTNAYNEKTYKFESLTSPEDFDTMTIVTEYARSTKEAKGKKRKYRRFKSGCYQPYFSKIIWDNTHLKCSWNFKNQTVNLSGTQGKVSGEYIFYR